MSEAPDVGSTEPQANPAPEPLSVADAARKLDQKRQEARQAPTEDAQEPTREPETPAEEPEIHEEPETAEAEAIDEIDYAEVAAPIDAERETDDLTGDDSPEPEFSLKFEGQERKVNRQEAIDLAQMGLDYRTKTQKLADDRKAVETERQTVAQELQRLQQDREKLQQHLQSFQTTLSPPDPELAETDPDEWTRQNARYTAEKAKADAVQAELDAEAQKAAEKARDDFKQWYDAQSQIVSVRVKPLAQKQVAEAVLNYLSKGIGFTGEHVQRGVHMADAKFQEIAYKAYMFDKARAKKVKPKAPKVSSGTGARRPPSGLDDMKKQVRKSGDPRDAAKLLDARRAQTRTAR